ncbi:PadR family transcriptional regulator [Rhodocytophaga aerolata]|uniref:PadR family transcriptional regulator n=1 Tax=Rhodocytophaga aerolata TaxID=455078 RepID=A0ABT8R182_9BACT|nr:PadR family transcriptional regulator [Rhodocytophaga aerolata]MDO1445852.1 PadR family transcriptional regulator [Rhodocytophaga aerolata]
MHSPELLKGMLKTIILKLLSEHKRMYGYEIIQAIKEISDGKIDMAVAAIYPVLHKLRDEGSLTIEKVAMGERVRIYYSLTPDGSSAAKEKIEELTDFLGTISKLMDFKPGLQSLFLV